jgi:hypothetical protein
MLVGLSICNLQEGGADNIKSICASENIGVVCWTIRVLEVDKALYFWAISCLSFELFDTFKELIDWVKLIS